MKQIVVKWCEILSLLFNSSDQHLFFIKGLLAHQASSKSEKDIQEVFYD